MAVVRVWLLEIRRLVLPMAEENPTWGHPDERFMQQMVSTLRAAEDGLLRGRFQLAIAAPDRTTKNASLRVESPVRPMLVRLDWSEEVRVVRAVGNQPGSSPLAAR